ncbi:MAG TPA: hypothetical protein VFZ78_07185, partial [Flavisolibacter sp.]
TVDWIVYYPFFWFASAWESLYRLQFDTIGSVSLLLSFAVPLACIFVVIRYLAPSFNNKLAMVDTASAPAKVPGKKERAASAGYAGWLARLTTRGAAERIGFLFTWKLSARSRDFKLKVYPGVGYMIMLVVVMYLNNRETTLREIAEENSSGKAMMLTMLYFSSVVLTMGLGQMFYSERYKAAWIFYTAPVARPGEVILGAAKAAIYKFYIPLAVAVTVLALAVIGPHVLPNILLALFNVLLLSMLLVVVSHKAFPFSLPQSNNQQGAGFLRNLFVLLIMGIMGAVHFILYDNNWAVIAGMVLSGTVTWLLMRSVRQISWAAVKRSNEEG